MMEFMSVFQLSQFGESLTFLDIFFRVLVSLSIGGLIGIDREMKNRPAGMRTHVLVCVGSMLIAMIEQETAADVIALDHAAVNVSMGRITSTVVSGVGFLGAGTIITSDRKVSGLTTAASLWCTACIGLAVGQGYIRMAAVSGILVLFILKLMQRVVHMNTLKRLEVQFVERPETTLFLQEYFLRMRVKVLAVDFHAENRETGHLYTNVYTLSMPGHMSSVDMIGMLSEHENILTVRTTNL